VSSPDERHATLGDRPRRGRLGLRPDLVDDDDLRHVVLHRFNHHRVLQGGIRYLHASSHADSRMRHVPVTRDFVGGIDDDHALPLLREYASTLTQHRRLADSGPAQQTDRLPAAQHIEENVDRSVDRATDPARQADDLPGTIANRTNPMQRLFDAGSIVGSEPGDTRACMLNIFRTHRRLAQIDDILFEARLRGAP
jgi:hypothetical protein